MRPKADLEKLKNAVTQECVSDRFATVAISHVTTVLFEMLMDASVSAPHAADFIALRIESCVGSSCTRCEDRLKVQMNEIQLPRFTE